MEKPVGILVLRKSNSKVCLNFVSTNEGTVQTSNAQIMHNWIILTELTKHHNLKLLLAKKH